MLINEVLTLKEAAELYSISISALRYACTGQKGYKPILPPKNVGNLAKHG